MPAINFTKEKYTKPLSCKEEDTTHGDEVNTGDADGEKTRTFGLGRPPSASL